MKKALASSSSKSQMLPSSLLLLCSKCFHIPDQKCKWSLSVTKFKLRLHIIMMFWLLLIHFIEKIIMYWNYHWLHVQVFAVRSGGETGVIVKGPTERNSFTFRMKDRGPLISVKFSYQHKVLAMQRNDRSVVSLSFCAICSSWIGAID